VNVNAGDAGSVLVEYVVLMAAVSLGLAAATAALGPILFRLYAAQVAVLALPIPL
jgi:hypothetical protein